MLQSRKRTLKSGWISLLLGVIRSSEGIQRLSDRYWELLVELAVSDKWSPRFEDIPGPEITKSLIDAQEWGKLECLIGFKWMYSTEGGITEEDLEHSTLLLLCQRPGAAQKLEQWMERWSQQRRKNIPELFQRILMQAHEAANDRMRRKWFLRSLDVPSHLEISFALGQLPMTSRPKNPRVRHRPEGTSSAYQIMSSDVWNVHANPLCALTPPFCKPVACQVHLPF
jgi:hypothetical protein